MAPKKSKTSKTALKKAGTMVATAAAGQEYLKQAWGEDKLNQVNALLDARDKSDTNNTSDAASSSTTPTTSAAVAAASTTASSTTSAKAKAKPKLSKARTMKATASEAKTLIGSETLGDTRSATKRRQAAVNAKKTLEAVTKPATTRKPALKRLGTMANTAREGKAYVKRVGGNKKKGKTTTGQKRKAAKSKGGKK